MKPNRELWMDAAGSEAPSPRRRWRDRLTIARLLIATCCGAAVMGFRTAWIQALSPDVNSTEGLPQYRLLLFVGGLGLWGILTCAAWNLERLWHGKVVGPGGVLAFAAAACLASLTLDWGYAGGLDGRHDIATGMMCLWWLIAACAARRGRWKRWFRGPFTETCSLWLATAGMGWGAWWLVRVYLSAWGD